MFSGWLVSLDYTLRVRHRFHDGFPWKPRDTLGCHFYELQELQDGVFQRFFSGNVCFVNLKFSTLFCFLPRIHGISSLDFLGFGLQILKSHTAKLKKYIEISFGGCRSSDMIPRKPETCVFLCFLWWKVVLMSPLSYSCVLHQSHLWGQKSVCLANVFWPFFFDQMSKLTRMWPVIRNNVVKFWPKPVGLLFLF